MTPMESPTHQVSQPNAAWPVLSGDIDCDVVGGELGRDADGGRDHGGDQAAEGEGEHDRSRGVEAPNRADEAVNEGRPRGRPEGCADADRRGDEPGMRLRLAQPDEPDQVGAGRADEDSRQGTPPTTQRGNEGDTGRWPDRRGESGHLGQGEGQEAEGGVEEGDGGSDDEDRRPTGAPIGQPGMRTRRLGPVDFSGHGASAGLSRWPALPARRTYYRHATQRSSVFFAGVI